MAERCYSDSMMRLHGRILTVPIAMACGMALGLFTQIEPFRSNLQVYVIALFVVLALTCAYFAFDKRGVTPVLRVGDDIVAVDSGGRVKLDWQDIKLISCESVPSQDGSGEGRVRVVIEARKSGRTGAALQRYFLDHTYGMSAQELCMTLAQHQQERQPEMTAIAAAQRASHAAFLRAREHREAAAQQEFGRRASDRRAS